jgi:hypothetical protein
MTQFVVVLAIIFAWLFALSFIFGRTFSFYNRLTKGVVGKNLKEILEEILSTEKKQQEDVKRIFERLERIENDGLLHIQKVGLVRFNPFADTGGDQSFVLALLDGKNSGVVVTSLHGRVGTRWYAKNIKEGKGENYELSEEEEKAIKIAR